jgi:small neutral amino acid transporter SnatA (MarC family)
MNELQTSLVFTFVSIFSMVNPIGMAPVFLEKTKDQPLWGGLKLLIASLSQ